MTAKETRKKDYRSKSKTNRVSGNKSLSVRRECSSSRIDTGVCKGHYGLSFQDQAQSSLVKKA